MSTQYQDDTTLQASRSKTAPPPLYKVLLLNDDFTPMDFVVAVLKRFFYRDETKATRVMLQVHTELLMAVAVLAPVISALRLLTAGQIT